MAKTNDLILVGGLIIGAAMYFNNRRRVKTPMVQAAEQINAATGLTNREENDLLFWLDEGNVMVDKESELLAWLDYGVGGGNI